MQNIAKVGYTTTCTGDLKQICVDLRVGYRTLKKNTNISSINKTQYEHLEYCYICIDKKKWPSKFRRKKRFFLYALTTILSLDIRTFRSKKLIIEEVIEIDTLSETVSYIDSHASDFCYCISLLSKATLTLSINISSNGETQMHTFVQRTEALVTTCTSRHTFFSKLKSYTILPENFFTLYKTLTDLIFDRTTNYTVNCRDT